MWINVALICPKLHRKVINSKFGNYGNFPYVKLMPTPCILKTYSDAKLDTEKTLNGELQTLTLIILQ